MKKIILLLPVIFFLSCGEDKAEGEVYDPARTERYVKYSNTKFEDYWLQQTRGVKAFFTPDACIILPDSTVCDTSAILSHMHELMKKGFAKQELMTMNITGNNDSLVENGLYVIRDSSGSQIERGSYTTTWKRYRGYFKYHRINKTKTPASQKSITPES